MSKGTFVAAGALALALAAGSAQAAVRTSTTGGGDAYGNGGQARYIPEDNSDAVAAPQAEPVVAGRKPGASSGIGV